MGVPRSGHTSVTELGKVAQLADVKKLVVYHHSFLGVERVVRDQMSGSGRFLFEPEMRYEAAYAIKQHYKGPVIIGEPLMILEVNSESDLIAN